MKNQVNDYVFFFVGVAGCIALVLLTVMFILFTR